MFQPIAVPMTIFGAVLLTAVVLWFIPRLTRHDLYFAVTVAPEFRDSREGRSILRRYRMELIVVSTLALAAAAAAAFWAARGTAPLALLALIAGSFIAYYRARKLVLPHAVSPTTIREAEIRGRNRKIPGGWVAASGPFILLAACAAYVGIHWEEIPTRFAVHWGAGGQPDRWAGRSLVFSPLLMTAAILAALTLILYGTAHWVRPIHPGGLQGARERKFRRTVMIILLGTEYFIALKSSWAAVLPLFPGQKAGPPGGTLMILLPLLLALAVVVVLIRLGQGGSRTSATEEEPPSDSAVPVGDRTQDCYWTLGVIYFNRGDPSVIVEKRFGIGYTFNFARPMSWVIILLVALVPVMAAILHFG